jgi:TonB-linked SusC/RagA family outer membrane protein
MQFSFAQEKTVTGVVSDAAGPIPGANVVVRGTTRGVQTDVDGRYAILAAPGEVLVFTFLGMTDATATVGASNTVNMILQEGGVQLGDVIITGALGIRRPQNAVTYANQLVPAEALVQAANPNVVQGLVGKVSGLQINTTNSSVNATTRIVIRAPRSITGNNQALVVIDGVISSASILQSLAPETIASVNVIKGTQGAALYGSEGVNGALIVTTKRGNGQDKMTISLNTSIDFSEVAYLPERQTRYGQGWYGENISYENGTWGPEFDGSVLPVGLPSPDGTYMMAPFVSRGSDNIKDFFQTGVVSQTGVSLSSGGDNGYVFFSANNLQNEFIVEKDALRRNTFLFRGGKKAGKWSVDGTMTYITQKTNNTSSSLYYDLLQTATNVDIQAYRNRGNEGNYSYFVRNPYWVIDNVRGETRSDIFTGIAGVQYDFNKNINVRYNANVNMINNRTTSYSNDYTDPYLIGGSDQSVESFYSTGNDSSRNFYGDLFLNFDYDLTENFNMRLLLGNNITDRLFTTTDVSGTNLAIPGLYNIGNVSSDVNGSNTFTRRRTYAFFGNLDLDYKNYLFLNLTGRYEAVSYLDADNNAFFYPSAGLSFVATNAFEGLKGSALSYAKIATSIVRVGRADVPAYDINRTYVQASGFPFGGVNSYIPNQQGVLRYNDLTDPLIEPEFYTTADVTMNLGFLKNRITLDASYYAGTNTNQIISVSSSYASGNPNLRTNIGETSTTGYEFDLGLIPFQGDFTWDLRLSLSHNQTTVEKVSDFSDEVAIYSPYGTYGIFATVGEEYPIIKGIGYLRDDQGRIIVDEETGVPLQTATPVKLGETTPDYILGLNTSVEYKGLRLAATMDYRTGHQYYSGTKSSLTYPGYLVETAENGRTGFIMPNSSYHPAGSPEGTFLPNTNIVTGGTSYNTYQDYIINNYRDVDENYILDATAFKVRELALSYSFSEKLLTGTGFNNVRVGVTARNPFTVLAKENRGYDDPEYSINNGNAVGLASGTSNSGTGGTNQYPNLRTYGFTVNLTF